MKGRKNESLGGGSMSDKAMKDQSWLHLFSVRFGTRSPSVSVVFRSFTRSLAHSFTSIAPLATFRMLFGAMMVFSTARFMALGWVADHYIEPKLHFHYYGFEWLEPLPAIAMYTVHVLMLLGALGIMLGAFYRLSALMFFLTFTYCELLDSTYYLNHYYFVSVVSFLLIWLPANRAASVDVWRRAIPSVRYVPAWTINIIKLQLALVYIYAGLAKIRYDWLINALPLKIWLPANDALPIIGPLFALPWMPYVFSWAGMLYDTFIVFFLLWPRSRPWAYATVVVFHLLTGLLFQIGVFPLVMIAATPIFFSVDWHERLLRWGKQGRGLGQGVWRSLAPKGIVQTLLLVFVCFQLVFPWRYLLYPGNLFWTEEGYRFGWRVMLMEKAGTATFFVRDSRTGHEGVVDNREFLNDHQEKQMAMQPDLIIQFAHYLANYYQKHGVYKPQVRAEVYVTLNARPSQLLIDPAIDLTQIQDSWAHKSWILSNEHN
ncbi:HTTM domain-containing protein [Spirosoma sp. SC4-14]|uniref:HTTM domain-containing protein n=1 Tax=Spirosoma sp. SC4-14 TaxID=3128900 RepID=UPI0030D3D6AB